MSIKKEKIIVLFGGWGPEREISCLSAKSVIEGLKNLGYQVFEHDLKRDLKEFIDYVQTVVPDLVFNTMHGPIGEDGTIQAILDFMQVPYTNSGLLASALAMDKWQTYQVFKAANVPTPATQKICIKGYVPTFPCVLKPINQGSSFGVSLIKNLHDWQKAMDDWNYGDEAIVQEYIRGLDIDVVLFNGKSIGTMELELGDGHNFNDYEAKYIDGHCKFHTPARLSEAALAQAHNAAEKAFIALGCKGLARADLLYYNEKMYVLELNTQPGFTKLSVCPQVFKAQGIEFENMLKMIVDSSLC